MKNRMSNLALVGPGFLTGAAVSWSTYIATAQSTTIAPTAANVAVQQATCQTSSETGHKVCGTFLTYWQQHGGLAQQGHPLSEEFVETSHLDGKSYNVQYFERAVFEYHPRNALQINEPPYDVLLSQLGTYMGKSRYTQGSPTTAGTVPFYEYRTDPVAALLSFYDAINRREYERAYSYFQGAPNPSSSLAPPYDQWVKGYADTASITVAVGKVVQDAGAGNIYATFPVVIVAKQSDDTLRVFAGCYVMHRVNTGISENRNDELWSINAANIRVIPDKANIDQLLAQTCSR